MRLLVVLACLGFAGCFSNKSVLVARPEDRALDQALTERWAQEIRRTARSGDWLLGRGYGLTSDVIIVASGGEAFSHAAIIDRERGTVIEALVPEITEVPIEAFVARYHHIAVVRPNGMNAHEQRVALARARSRLGAEFDVGGMLGSNDETKFYCSELVYWASGAAARDRDHDQRAVVTPQALLELGAVRYFSGRRDDPQMLRAAAGWRRARVSQVDR